MESFVHTRVKARTLSGHSFAVVLYFLEDRFGLVMQGGLTFAVGTVPPMRVSTRSDTSKGDLCLNELIWATASRT